MAKLIAREDHALSVGGGSCSSYSASRAVTKAKAVSFGCTIRISYADNLLVAKCDLLKITGCSCDVHNRTMCGSNGYCGSNCSCNSHTTTYCSSKTFTPSSGSHCSKTLVSWTPESSGSCNCNGGHGPQCWPMGSIHTIGCISTGPSVGEYSGSGSSCSTTGYRCGCNSIALGCGCYAPSCSKTNSGCCCNAVYTCNCYNIQPMMGKCGCHNSICSGYSAGSCSCHNNVCSCNSGNCGNTAATCSCNGSICSCNSANCSGHRSSSCSKDCPSDGVI